MPGPGLREMSGKEVEFEWADSQALFYFADEQGLIRPLAFSRPEAVFAARELSEVRPVLREAERAAFRGRFVAGFVTYEAAGAFDAAHRTRPPGPLPLAWFAVYEEGVTARPAAFTRSDQGESQPGESARPLFARGPAEGGFRFSVGAEEAARSIAAIRESIRAGDVYQVNYSARVRGAFSGDDRALFRRLAAAQNAPYSAYLDLGRRRILSVSPELFFRREGRRILTRPMKGTAPRGRWTEEDRILRERLGHSEKDRAENVMIVDLLRNDLGRVAEPGSVRVSRLFEVETYPTVHQMTSSVEAVCREGVSLEDLFCALFPSGSVTGAPKAAAMKRIAELEDSPRGVYCGAIGYLAPGGDATFSVAIRTLAADAQTGVWEYGSGAGITWDSSPESEWEEIGIKARVLAEAVSTGIDRANGFGLFETLRLEDGAYLLPDRHIRRMLDSAGYFGFAADGGEVRRALAETAKLRPAGAHRVRIELSRDGMLRIETAPLSGKDALFLGSLAGPGDSAPKPRTAALASAEVDASDRMAYHKTSRRERFERELRRHPEAFDVLFFNRRGEVAEFSTGNAVLEIGGEWLTPARSGGLLAGTLREELLSAGVIREAVLVRDDLFRADRVWLINSVRGWVPVRIVHH